MNGKKKLPHIVVAIFLVGLMPLFCPQPSSAIPSSNDWVAHPLYISPYAGSPDPVGYIPEQIREAYNLPSDGGNGSTIAIVIAYHTPNIEEYFNTFSVEFGLPDNITSPGSFIVHKMAEDIDLDSSWSMEACLDVQWSHAIAPRAKILLVEAVNAYSSSLLDAVDFATSYPGVVAVSMSWGGEEDFWQTSLEGHFYKSGIEFFAASGDDGLNVSWPASSAGVVSVGGTTLNLNPDGTVISETAWKGSSGGVSQYIPRPWYQTNIGLNYSNRAVPDVSYNGNVLTGVAVYNGTWWKVGGTSAGAPQWAGIYALNRTATNTNIYISAKSAYSSDFRDITVGSNYVASTAVGYDLVTGLGSPLTTIFGTQLLLSNDSGAPESELSLIGKGFAGSSVNLSYLNPHNSSWIPINNTETLNGNFTYLTNVPDLLECNPSGDNSPLFSKIIFRATDISNGKTYNATYNEFRRGLSQVGFVNAQGLYGNNTDLTTTVFVQSSVTVPLVGRWFRPGVASLFWDGSFVGNAVIDVAGSFSASLTVGDTIVGQHTLTVSDGVANFCVNVTCLPKITVDYTDVWRTADFTVTLSPDSSVEEIFYRVNGGDLLSVSANGQPAVTTESASNTLEYWGAWNISEKETIELPHVTLTGVKLDKTLPVGSISTIPTTTSVYITLSVSASDATSGVSQMRFSNDGGNWSLWEPYVTSKSWEVPSGLDTKTVYAQFSDNAGLTSSASCTVTLQSVQTTSSTDTPTTTPTPKATAEPIPAVPEFNVSIVFFFMLTLISVLSATVLKRRRLL